MTIFFLNSYRYIYKYDAKNIYIFYHIFNIFSIYNYFIYKNIP